MGWRQLTQPISANDPGDWKSFQIHAQHDFSGVWDVELRERPVLVGGKVSWKFDLISLDQRNFLFFNEHDMPSACRMLAWIARRQFDTSMVAGLRVGIAGRKNDPRHDTDGYPIQEEQR